MRVKSTKLDGDVMAKKKLKSKSSSLSKTKARTRRPRASATKAVATKAELQYIPWHTIDLENLNPLLQRQFIVGEDLTIPPHMLHKAEALVDTVDLDVFTPPRADWINKTDRYLRGRK